MNESPNRPVVGLGEVLWDCFPDQQHPGGAPANFAFHARQLGLLGVVCSRVGDDDLGRKFRAYLQAHGLSDEFLQHDPEHPTGRVDVNLARPDDPQYTFVENSAWDHLAATDEALDLMRRAAAICFGTLAQRSAQSRATIHRCLNAAPPDCTILYDVNLRSPWYAPEWIESSLAAADIVKINDEERQILTRMLEFPATGDDDPARADFAHALRERFGVDLVCITRGAQGAFLCDAEGFVTAAAEPIRVADPVGAGDAFTAALYYAVTRGWASATICRFANQFAGLVAAQHGAMPQLRDELQRLLKDTTQQESA